MQPGISVRGRFFCRNVILGVWIFEIRSMPLWGPWAFWENQPFLLKMAEFLNSAPVCDRESVLPSKDAEYITFNEKWRRRRKKINFWLFLANFCKNGWFLETDIGLRGRIRFFSKISAMHDFYRGKTISKQKLWYLAGFGWFLAKMADF